MVSKLLGRGDVLISLWMSRDPRNPRLAFINSPARWGLLIQPLPFDRDEKMAAREDSPKVPQVPTPSRTGVPVPDSFRVTFLWFRTSNSGYNQGDPFNLSFKPE